MKNINSIADHESGVITYSSDDAIRARKEIHRRLKSYQATDDEAERSLGLFLRGSLLARILAIHEIYLRIQKLPGCIFDIGTWRGQTAILCENFRAIHEPLNFNRRIAAFDTFNGYTGFSSKDRATELHRDGTYSVGGNNYAKYLEELLILHEQSNAMGHNNGKHKIIVGDCRDTIPEFFRAHPNEVVALAFFDLNTYESTSAAFELVYSRLVPGGIIAFWQLTRDAIQAEGNFYAEKIIKLPHTIQRCDTYPGLCYIQKS